MKYGISRLTYSPAHFIQIPQAEYKAIFKARADVLTFVGIERKFDLLVENYADYERELLEVSLQSLLVSESSYAREQDQGLAIERRLANLLTTAKLYLDQVDSDLSKVYRNKSDVRKHRDQARSKQRETSQEYRVVEELRNHLQHRGMPLWGVTYPSSWNDSLTRLRFGVEPLLDVTQLRDDGFDKHIIRELEREGEQVPLTPFVRKYVEGLGIVHQALGAVTAADLTKWQTVLMGALNRGFAQFGNEGGAVSLVVLDDTGELTSEHHIFRAQWEYGNDLAEKNGHLTGLSSRYISTANKKGDG